MAPGARHPLSPGGSSHGGRHHSGEALQRRQAGRGSWRPAVLRQGGRRRGSHTGAKQPLLCRERQKAALAARGRHSPSRDVPARSAGGALSLGGRCPSPVQQALAAPQPSCGFASHSPLSSCHRAASPHSSRPSLTAPLQGALLPQERACTLPCFTPWRSYRAREALPSEDKYPGTEPSGTTWMANAVV